MLLGIRWGSLRAKIVAWAFVPTAIILAAVAWVTFAAYQQVTEDLVIERDQELTRLLTGEFAAGLTEYTGLLAEYTGLLADLARSAYVYENDPAAQRSALRRARSRFEVFDGGVLILDNHGVVVAAEPERPEILGQNWSSRSYFRHMLRSPGSVFSDVVADGPQGSDVIVVAVPIKGDQGQFLGIMAGMFRLGAASISPFYRDIARLRIGEGGSAYLVDGAGRVIYHSDPERIGDDLAAHATVQHVLRGRVGALRTRDLDGREIVASFAPVPGTSWGLVTETVWAMLTRGSRRYQRFLLVLLVLGVVVPALVVAVGVRRITKPIVELIGAAQEMAGGHFGQAITARTGDEIEELADQFNRMAAQLQGSYADLERAVAALNAVAVVVSQSLDLDEMLNDALEKTLQVVESEAGGIYLLDERAQVLTVAAQRGLDSRFIAEIDRLKVGEGFSGRVAQCGRPLVVRNVSADPRLTRMAVREEGLRSLAVVPLNAKGKVLGTLFAATHGYREFTDREVQLLTSIGHQIGIAVENARLFGQVGQRMQELEALYHADEKMHRHLHLDQVLQALVDVAVDILQADKSAVLVWSDKACTEGRDRLRVRVARGFSPEAMAQLSFTHGDGITGQVATHGDLVVVEDVLTDPRREDERPEVLRAVDTEGVRSLMHLPIRIDSGVFGVFNVSFTEPHAFGEHERRLFQALTQRAALAIENAQLYEQTQELAVVEERSRLARELHDAVTQTLFSASLIAEILPALWEGNPQEGRQLLQELRQLSRGALAEMRTLLLELRPAALVEADLDGLLRQLAEALTGREGIPVAVTMEGQVDLPAEVHVALYRIAQEALNNVVKHAQASQVEVSLRCAPFFPSDRVRSDFSLSRGEEGEPAPSTVEGARVELCIRDNGRGFDPGNVPPDRLGLGIIRERAQAIGAVLEIDSQLGRGTQVKVVWTKDE
jgi:nitrate/nitrite-specific signal transduction histidine kinase